MDKRDVLRELDRFEGSRTTRDNAENLSKCPLFVVTQGETTQITEQRGEIPRGVRPLPESIRLRLVRTRRDPEVQINTPAEAAALVSDLSDFSQEAGRLILLDARKRVVGVSTLFLGGTDFALIDPGTVIKAAALANASSFIVAHNHPSGDPTPSGEDKQLLVNLREAGRVTNIKLRDFLIIGRRTYTSLGGTGGTPIEAPLLMKEVAREGAA